MLFHLPGTATEDMALGAGRSVPACTAEAGDARVAAIRDAVMQALGGLAPNSLHTDPSRSGRGALPGSGYQR